MAISENTVAEAELMAIDEINAKGGVTIDGKKLKIVPVEEDGASDKQKAQQNKMTSCNKEAGEKNMKGEERKKFMSNCLKG